MNYCNFSKVFLTRSTKDASTLHWWENHKSVQNETEKQVAPHFNTSISLQGRYDNYMKFVNRYPKLYLSFDKFKNQNQTLQRYLHEPKYYVHNNKQRERSLFTDHFSLKTWESLQESEKRRHTLVNCLPCITELQHEPISRLHKSYDKMSSSSGNIASLCKEIAHDLGNSQLHSKKAGLQAVKNVVTFVQPAVEKKLQIKFDVPLAESLGVCESFTELKRQKVTNTKNVRDEIESCFQDSDWQGFLSSTKSYAQYDRERLHNSYISTEEAKELRTKRLKRKKKYHTGKFSNYAFDKKAFLDEMRSYGKSKPINWTRLAKKYNIQLNGKFPGNAGQVLKSFARANGVVHSQHLKRIRRSKKKIGKSNISIPSARPASKIKSIIRQKVENKEIYIGEKIALKVVKTAKIDNSGNLKEITKNLHSRKFPLQTVIENEIKRFIEAGIIRNNSNKFHLKFWHDHSDILNHTYVNFMVSFIYSPELFLTEQEFTAKYPQKKALEVQSFVERPNLYIFGQSGSSDEEQLKYSTSRIEDIQSIRNLSNAPVVRVFVGDNPARQFEAGQQRGGHYSCICRVHANEHTNLEHCLKVESLTLEERRKLIIKGILWKRLEDGKINPFQNLKKQELIDELEARGIWDYKDKKTDLQIQLQDILRGVNRPPALMFPEPKDSASDANINRYEVLCCEPLHDICNIVQNIITELPVHVDDTVRKEYESFSQVTIGDKNQLKGSDARMFAIQLASFISSSLEKGQVSEDLQQLVNSLVDIITICYSKDAARSPKQVLRLFNQCFLFGYLCKQIFSDPKKVSKRKFFGNHFHSLVVHFPETYRIFCLRSLLPEQEERSFGELRSISEMTSNRQASFIVDNAVLRFTQRQKSNMKVNYFEKQDSAISKQAKLLPKRGRTSFKPRHVKCQSLFQSHLERIADFILCGKGVWWSTEGNDVVFFDGPDDDQFRDEGPQLHSFTSSSLHDERLYLTQQWIECISRNQSGQLDIPLRKLRIYDDNGKVLLEQCRTTHNASDDSDYNNKEQDEPPPDDDITTTRNASPGSGFNNEGKDGLPPDDYITTNRNASDDSDYNNKEQDEPPPDDDITTTRNGSGFNNEGKDGLPPDDYITTNRNDLQNDEMMKNQSNNMSSNAGTSTKSSVQLQVNRLPVKRKLFTPSSQSAESSTYQSLLSEIMGDAEEVVSFVKYRRLHKQHPGDKSLKLSYNKAQCMLEMAVSKKHGNYKKEGNRNMMKKAEKLLDHWGVYYF